MQLPPESTSVGRVLRGSRRTLAHLEANPQAKALHPKFKERHDRLKAAQSGYTEPQGHVECSGSTCENCEVIASQLGPWLFPCRRCNGQPVAVVEQMGDCGVFPTRDGRFVVRGCNADEDCRSFEPALCGDHNFCETFQACD